MIAIQAVSGLAGGALCGQAVRGCRRCHHVCMRWSSMSLWADGFIKID